jgi:toxin-antitoxin system PIN domain toxin
MTYLLDVNVLVALAWPTHAAHHGTQAWFGKHASSGWATCPFTETAFVRILSNPAFSADAVSPREACALLKANVQHPHHEFWADDISLVDAVNLFVGNLVGHQQVSDTYLLGLAIHRRGVLATLDHSIQALLPKGIHKKADVLSVI